MSAPSITLPKGGGAIRGIDEKFQVNPATGTGSLSIPIVTSPGRGGLGPQLALNYDSGAGNGPFGLGWSLTLPNITRKTDRGLPRYYDAADSDTFILTGAEDLVPVLVETQGDWQPEVAAPRVVDGATYSIRRYRPRTEGLFARIERWTNQASGAAHWRAITPDNVASVYGRSAAHRIADPADMRRVFSWLLEETYDGKGNVIRYEYKLEDASGVGASQPYERNRLGAGYANRYLKRILYGNSTAYLPNLHGFNQAAWEAKNTWYFQAVFDYGEHEDAGRPWAETQPWELRPDSFSRYRSGFEIRTQRRCRRVLMFHHFPAEAGFGGDPTLVRATEFAYGEPNPILSYLTAAWQTGYIQAADGSVLAQSMPPVEFGYLPVEIDEQVRVLGPDSLENLPGGLYGRQYQLLDLNGEGISGILTEQGEGWFYKRNLGNFPFDNGAPLTQPPEPPAPFVATSAPPTFSPAQLVARMPTVADQAGPQQQWLDLAGDGLLDLVLLGGAAGGFYERENDSWTNFTPFEIAARVDWGDPNQRLVDLTGDGHADILITEDLVFRWHPSLGEAGFGPAETAARSFDEERGPALILADAEQSIYLADMAGDGLVAIVRVRNGEVCYWPNLGYGRFGAKVTMSHAPVFDAPDLFDQRRVRLADIDGSGTTDIIYLGRDGVKLYFNEAGNSWSDPTRLAVFPQVDNLASVSVADLLGNGTACLVWSSALPGDAHQPLRYVDLMGGQKPHLLYRVVNNMGAQTTLSYAPSTKFYLADERAGRPWITRLPFPVHVVEAVEVLDRLSQTRYVTRYAYHHGYFDGQEREFRGFGLVEQWDTDSFAAFAEHDPWPHSPHGSEAAHHLPPAYTKSWFHTGAFLAREAISSHYAAEYYAGDAQAKLLPDTALPGDLTVEETREACRALRGQMLRQEVYAVDGTTASQHPYAVTEQNFELRMLQPRRDGRFAVFLSHAREAISYHYERDPDDPRISHALTLEVDDYGNDTRAVAAAYPRRATMADRLPEQEQLYLTCSEAEFVNRADRDDFYLVKIPYESRSYELAELTPSPDGYFDWAELRAAMAAIPPADELPYEATPAGNRAQKRLLTRTRTRYYRADLVAPMGWDEMDDGEIGAPLLPYETYRAVFSQALLEQVFGPKIGYDELADVLQGQAGDQGGYVFEDGLWWIPSGRQVYAPDDVVDAAAYARARFYLPTASQDPFGQRSRIAYDEPYFLFPTRVEDPLGNVVHAEIDYRVLQPWRVADPNGNRSQAAFDALGMVVGTAIGGKETESLGDSLDNFVAELGRDAIRAALEAADPRAAALPLLGNASTRLVYDVWRFYDTQHDAQPQPNVVWSIARETHVSDLAPDEIPRLQHSFLYSDSLGREILTKVQAEPGPLQVYDPATGQWREEWAGPDEQPFDPRWVGSGRTVFNNKGKPVKQYEPFFSASHAYESEAEAVMQGVTPTLAYDPLGRLVRTDLPNKTFSRVEFDAWQQTSWDPNDTVVQSGWYDERGQPDPQAVGEPDDPEVRAAWLAAEHANTPTIQYLDSLGRPFLSVTHNREVRRDSADRITEIREYRIPTRTQLDVEGNPLAIRDGRGIDAQPAADPLSYAGGNAVMRYRYAMGGVQLHQQSMDAGERWMLNDVSGKPIRAWDSRGHAFRTEYDALRRPIRQFVRGTDATHSDPHVFDREVLCQQTEYGEGQADNIAHNLRTRVFKSYDCAGVVTSEAYDFKGNLLRSTRQLAADYKGVPDWSGTVALEQEIFASSTSYDALNRPIQLLAPHAGARVDVIRPTYNEANLLEKVDVWSRYQGEPEQLLDPGTASSHPVLDIDYDAKGQRVLIAYGIGVQTSYDYDPLTFRLVNLKTRRGSDSAVLQDLSYTYDPAGNITAIRDGAQPRIYFANDVVGANARYAYDALYQLVAAGGRENWDDRGQMDHTDPPYMSGFPHHNGPQAVRRYAERYAYDAVGNIVSMGHRAAGSVWTRRYAYAADSNRLLATSVPGDRAGEYSARYEYDPHGNMTRMPHLPLMQWDYRGQLQASSQQVRSDGGTPEITYYVYDSAGQRVRKVTERQADPNQTPTRMKERIYLGGFEIYREYDGGGTNVTLERETLHVMDGTHRIALVETKTLDSQLPTPNSQPLARYQLGNHLGSVILELSDTGVPISYEEYHPYGTTAYHATDSSIEVSLKRYRYTGKEKDTETGLYYHGVRYYACWLGRWTAADPIGLRGGMNVFAYAANAPATHVDLNGLDPSQVVQDQGSLVQEAQTPRGQAQQDNYIGTEYIDVSDAITARAEQILLESERQYREEQRKMVEALGFDYSPDVDTQTPSLDGITEAYPLIQLGMPTERSFDPRAISAYEKALESPMDAVAMVALERVSQWTANTKQEFGALIYTPLSEAELFGTLNGGRRKENIVRDVANDKVSLVRIDYYAGTTGATNTAAGIAYSVKMPSLELANWDAMVHSHPIREGYDGRVTDGFTWPYDITILKAPGNRGSGAVPSYYAVPGYLADHRTVENSDGTTTLEQVFLRYYNAYPSATDRFNGKFGEKVPGALIMHRPAQ